MVLDISKFTSKSQREELSHVIYESAVDLRHAVHFKGKEHKRETKDRIDSRLSTWHERHGIEDEEQKKKVKQLHDYHLVRDYKEATGRKLGFWQQWFFKLEPYRIESTLPETIAAKDPALASLLSRRARRIGSLIIGTSRFNFKVNQKIARMREEVSDRIHFYSSLNREEQDIAMKVFQNKIEKYRMGLANPNSRLES